MFLNLQIHKYDQHIFPYIKNGIIIDTSVLKIIIDGLITTRITKKQSPEFNQVMSFLDILKMTEQWQKFFITPHILTETFTHFRNDYSNWKNFRELCEEIFPIFKEMAEKNVNKDEIFQFIDNKNPVVEVGDISIFVAVDDFVKRKVKFAILANDRSLNARYETSNNVMVLNYKSNLLNLL